MTPAILGGRPIRSTPLPISRPTLHTDDQVADRLRAIVASGDLTDGAHVAAFEREAAQYLDVADVVAVSSCTAGLMLVLQALSLRGAVAVPSFTFMASGHSVIWNGLRPALVDCSPDTLTAGADEVAGALTAGASAVLGVHTFGVPCPADALAAAAATSGARLVLDAAHGFGARYPDGTRVGTKGVAEVFSLSPTKSLAVGEGGLIATGDPGLARHLRIARNYGNPGDYDARFAGLSARMPEMAAAVGRSGLPHVDGWLARRRALAGRYLDNLAGLPGLTFQRVPAGAVSTYKDFCVLVDADGFGLGRDALADALAAEGIATRKYFDPPLHRQQAYSRYQEADGGMPVTEIIAARCLSLPLYSHLDGASLDQVCTAVHTVHRHAEAIAARLTERASVPS